MDELIPLRSSIHLHTYASDGWGSISEICEAAGQEGLDCIVISDHDTLGHNLNGYAGDLLVITGEEVTPLYKEKLTEKGEIKGASANNHILTLGLEHGVENGGRTSQELIDLIEERGGMSFLAHPDEPGHPWSDWSVTGFTGLEIWTYKAAWKRGMAEAPSKTYAWRNPDSVLAGPSERQLRLWDSLGRDRRIVGLGCADNHCYVSSIEGVHRAIFPWNVGMTGIVSYVWVEPGELARDPARAFLKAVKNGRVIIAHDGLATARGFSVRAKNLRTAETYWPGDRVENWIDVGIDVLSPEVATVRVLKDGIVFHEEETRRCEAPVDGEGVWRIEARLAGRPWVYANPFYIGVWG